MNHMRWFCVITLLVWPVSAQDVTIRTQSNLVVAPTTVTDAKGNFVDGLLESDFLVLDNGKPQAVRMDTSDIALTPISVVVAVDSGSLSGPALAKIRKVGSVIQPLITGDRGEAAILRFSREVHVVQEFTGDADRIVNAFSSLKPAGGQARSLDAVKAAIEMLRDRPGNRRRIVVLVSESKDRGSETKLPEVLQLAQQANVTVFPVTYSAHSQMWTGKPADAQPVANQMNLLFLVGELVRLGSTNTARELARFTGGRQISFLSLRALEQDLSRIGEELHSQYLLSFAPQRAEGDDSFHAIEVKVKGRPELIVVTRPGYWPVW